MFQLEKHKCKMLKNKLDDLEGSLCENYRFYLSFNVVKIADKEYKNKSNSKDIYDHIKSLGR